MKQQDKNIWIDEVMGSLDGLKPVAVPDGIYEGVKERVRQGGAKKAARIIPRIAAAAVVLLSLNIFTVYKMNRINVSVHTDANQVSTILDEQITNLDAY